MTRKKNKYDTSDELSISTAFLAAGNIFMDAADIAYRREDTDSLMEAGERLLKLGAIMMGATIETEDSHAVSDASDADDETADEKVKLGFVK